MKATTAVLLLVLAVPGLAMAKNQLDEFDLRCTSGDGATPARTFHFDISDEGKTVVSEPGVSSATHDADVYANAFVWEAGGVRYIAERFQGELTTFPESARWQCAKVGGKKF